MCQINEILGKLIVLTCLRVQYSQQIICTVSDKPKPCVIPNIYMEEVSVIFVLYT